MAILIVASESDPEGQRAAEELRRRNARAVWLDSAAFPLGLKLSMEAERIKIGRRRIKVPRSVYVRGLASHPLGFQAQNELERRPRGFIAQCDEKRAILESILLELETRGARLVNSLESNALHSQKPFQLARLQAAGLPVPKWIATNDAEAVRAFVKDVESVIYKPLAGGATVRLLEAKDLTRARLAKLAHAPVLFQERLVGLPIRAFVAGDKVIASAAIHSTELDYRGHERSVVSIGLTREEKRAVVGAARVCGMQFSGVDLMRGEESFALLECNPSPMFATFEEMTGLNVAGALADLLLLKRAEARVHFAP